ncbi:hypothetical protein D3C75_1324080 [compost metagenome]
MLVFGLALILVMRFRPEGLWPSSRRRAELHEDESEALVPAPALESNVEHLESATAEFRLKEVNKV